MGRSDFFTAAGGLKIEHVLTLPLLARSGFLHFFGTKGLEPGALSEFKERWALRQVHGDQVVVASEGMPMPALGDGLVTDRPEVLLTVSTADCLPILLIDPESRAVSALHAGWRGTVLNIAARGVALLQQCYGSKAASLLAGIGPGIGRCCFEVGHEVWQTIEEKYSYGKNVISNRAGEKAHVDLAQLNRLQLLEAGLLPERVASMDLCTVCDATRFYSYRRDKVRTGSMISGVMRRSS